MTTACVPTTAVTGTSSLLSTVPETGRGQASLWTAAAAPDHRLWTTLRGPLDPSRLPTCPLPRRRRRASRNLSITTNQRRDDLRTLLQAPVAEPALVNIDSPQTGGPFPSIKVGHTGLSKVATMVATPDAAEMAPNAGSVAERPTTSNQKLLASSAKWLCVTQPLCGW